MKSLALLATALDYLSFAAAWSGTTREEADCNAWPDDSSATIVTYPKKTDLDLACYILGSASDPRVDDSWLMVRRYQPANRPPIENPSIRSCYVRGRKVQLAMNLLALPMRECKNMIPRSETLDEREYAKERDWNEEE